MKFSNDKVKQVIDPSGLTWCEMALLKKKDPFMYYSIPGNRDKKLPGENIDLSELHLSSSGNVSRSFTTGAPMKDSDHKSPRRHSHTLRRGSETKKEKNIKCVNHARHSTSSEIETKLVERKTAISYESYVDKVLEDVIEEAAALQPNATRRTSDGSTDRRGSVLEDILFNAIAELNGLEEFTYDTEPESEPDFD